MTMPEAPVPGLRPASGLFGQHQGTSAALLKQSGVKVTLARLAVLDVLQRHAGPCSVKGIHQQLADEGMTLNLGTLYATLRHLYATGVVAAHGELGPAVMYAVRVPAGEVKLVCLHCEDTVQVTDERLGALVAQACDAQGAELRDFALTVSVAVICASSPATRRP